MSKRRSASERLDAYMKKHDLSSNALAVRVGAHRAQILRLRRGERKPRLKLAVALERETGIPAGDWL